MKVENRGPAVAVSARDPKDRDAMIDFPENGVAELSDEAGAYYVAEYPRRFFKVEQPAMPKKKK